MTPSRTPLPISTVTRRPRTELEARANALLLLGKPAEAEALYRAVVALEERSAPRGNVLRTNLMNLANALQALGRTEEALPHYRAVLAQNPDDAPAHTNLGVALQRLGRTDEAIEHYFGSVQANIQSRMFIYRVLADFKWSLWALIQMNISTIDFDFYKLSMWKSMRLRSGIRGPRWSQALASL